VKRSKSTFVSAGTCADRIQIFNIVWIEKGYAIGSKTNRTHRQRSGGRIDGHRGVGTRLWIGRNLPTVALRRQSVRIVVAAIARGTGRHWKGANLVTRNAVTGDCQNGRTGVGTGYTVGCTGGGRRCFVPDVGRSRRTTFRATVRLGWHIGRCDGERNLIRRDAGHQIGGHITGAGLRIGGGSTVRKGRHTFGIHIGIHRITRHLSVVAAQNVWRSGRHMIQVACLGRRNQNTTTITITTTKRIK